MVSAIILRSASAVDEGGITPARNEQASSDEQLLKLWLHGRGPNTQRAYRGDVARFLTFAAKPLQAVTLADLQDFADTLTGLAPASQCRVLSSVKSLLSFGHRIGYLAFDVGRPLRLPANRNRLSERILGEGAIHKILALEPSRRNRAILRLLYAAGLRVFELCALTRQDLQERDEAGQVTVLGKGRKTRTVSSNTLAMVSSRVALKRSLSQRFTCLTVTTPRSYNRSQALSNEGRRLARLGQLIRRIFQHLRMLVGSSLGTEYSSSRR